MRTLIIIPARLSSTRLPRKLLLAETGKPLIAHVTEAASKVNESIPPLVAIDSTEPEAKDFETVRIGSPRIFTRRNHPNGTSRAAEAVEIVQQFAPGNPNANPECVAILQADEPEIDPAHIRQLVEELERHSEWDCATLANHRRWDDNPNHVKAWIDVETDLASDFTRRLPDLQGGFPCCGLHIGVYAYRAAALQRYAVAGPCEREQAESLEQLRALHIGLRMGVVLVDHRGHGIDTREDYDAFVKRWRERNGDSSRDSVAG